MIFSFAKYFETPAKIKIEQITPDFWLDDEKKKYAKYKSMEIYLSTIYLHNNSMMPDGVIKTNGNIFRVTGHLCWELTGHRWILHTKASDAELWCFIWSAPEWTVE